MDRTGCSAVQSDFVAAFVAERSEEVGGEVPFAGAGQDRHDQLAGVSGRCATSTAAQAMAPELMPERGLLLGHDRGSPENGRYRAIFRDEDRNSAASWA